jgi:alkylation response protein AidB-like acyl-CoA dehydrogenase
MLADMAAGVEASRLLTYKVQLTAKKRPRDIRIDLFAVGVAA